LTREDKGELLTLTAADDGTVKAAVLGEDVPAAGVASAVDELTIAATAEVEELTGAAAEESAVETGGEEDEEEEDGTKLGSSTVFPLLRTVWVAGAVDESSITGNDTPPTVEVVGNCTAKGAVEAMGRSRGAVEPMDSTRGMDDEMMEGLGKSEELEDSMDMKGVGDEKAEESLGGLEMSVEEEVRVEEERDRN